MTRSIVYIVSNDCVVMRVCDDFETAEYWEKQFIGSRIDAWPVERRSFDRPPNAKHSEWCGCSFCCPAPSS